MSLHSEVDFRNTVDTGEPEADAIVPYTDGEPANQAILRRPVENNRSRTDIMRSILRNLVVLSDMDRPGMLMNSTGAVTFAGAKATYAGTITLAANLEIFPYATPGDDSVGVPYLASQKATLTTGSPDGVTLTSKYKQWEAPGGGDPAIAQEANMISVEIKDTGSLTVDVEGATGEVNNIVVGIDFGTTTVQQVVDAINADTDANKLVVATVFGTAGNACPKFSEAEWGTDYSARFLRGGAAGIAHIITNANLATFFGAHADNPLRKGDTLAIWYDKLVDLSGSPADDGRFQSTYENTNQTIPATALFNSRREPEKIPNSIPICKCLTDDRIQFADGTIILRTVPAKIGIGSLGELSPLADIGAWDRIGTGPYHNPATTIREALNNIDGHTNDLLNEVIAARTSDVFGTKGSLDARLEAAEDHATLVVSCTDGTSSTGGMYNGPDSVENALNALKAVGGTIYVAKGTTYEILNPIAGGITKPIRLIGIDGRAQTTINTEITGAAIGFNTGSEGSLIENLTFALPGSGTAHQISISAPNVQLVNVKVIGNVVVTANGINAVFQSCILHSTSGTNLDCIEIYAPDVTLRDCDVILEDAGEHAVMFAHTAHRLLLDNVRIETGDNMTGIYGEGDAGLTFVVDVTFRKIKFKCAPYTAGTHVLDLGWSATNKLHLEGFRATDLSFEFTGAASAAIAGGILYVHNGQNIKVDGFTADFGSHIFKFQNIVADKKGVIWIVGSGEVTNVHLLNGVVPNTGVTGYELDTNGAIVNLFNQTATGDGGLAWSHSRIAGMTEDGTPSGNSGLVIFQNVMTGITPGKECIVLDNVTIDCYNLEDARGTSNRMMLDILGCADIHSCRFRDGYWLYMFNLDPGNEDLKFRSNSVWNQNPDGIVRMINALNGAGYLVITSNSFTFWDVADAGYFYYNGNSNSYCVFDANQVWNVSQAVRTTAPIMFRNGGNYNAYHGNSVRYDSPNMTLFVEAGVGTSPAFGSFGTYNALHAA
jgi:hypothetical protein